MGWELIVVRRTAGDMMDRWLSRWAANVERYASLSCVRLIMPWSSAAQRFCTSELKSQIIARAIRARHPAGPVVSAVGIRREESAARARMPVAKRDERLTRARGIGQPGQSLGLVPATPRQHCGHRRVDQLRDPCVRYAVRGQQHDPRTLRGCRRNRGSASPALELISITRSKNQGRSRTICHAP